MSLEWQQARSGTLAWSNPVSWWWGLLTLVSGVNIAVWFALYRELPLQPAGAAGGTAGIGMMLLFCGPTFSAAPSGRFCRARTFRDLSVRHLVVEHSGRTVGGDRGRDLFRSAVGHSPAPARHDDRRGNDRECRVGDRTSDPDRGMPLMVCGADQELSRQRHRKFAVGGCLFCHRRRSLPPAAGIPWRGSRGPGHSHRKHCGLSRFSDDDRRPDVPEALADREMPMATSA